MLFQCLWWWILMQSVRKKHFPSLAWYTGNLYLVIIGGKLLNIYSFKYISNCLLDMGSPPVWTWLPEKPEKVPASSMCLHRLPLLEPLPGYPLGLFPYFKKVSAEIGLSWLSFKKLALTSITLHFLTVHYFSSLLLSSLSILSTCLLMYYLSAAMWVPWKQELFFSHSLLYSDSNRECNIGGV